jgi:Serine dehydrogenase proteinase
MPARKKRTNSEATPQNQDPTTTDQPIDSAHAPTDAPEAPAASEPPAEPKPLAWPLFVQSASDPEIRERFVREVTEIAAPLTSKAAVLALLKPEDSIGSFDLDQVFNALGALNPRGEKDVYLILLSRGGEIEPAYQISKLCRSFAKKRFVVVVPRQAKSAATMIALGADQIQIGPLGQLGPIDPQVGGLPALGVAQALQTIANLAQQYPGSSEMFARYLKLAVDVEQIGYYDRVSASAVQYAERLLVTKPALSEKAADIAQQLVYTYKHHGFVIDADEAQRLLGNDWVLDQSSELEIAERIYTLFDWVNLWLGIHRKKRLVVIGRLDAWGPLVLQNKE